MSDTIKDTLELVGFDDDVTVTAQSVYDLTSRELHLYVYLIIRRRSGIMFPTLEQIAADLKRDDQSWSEPTVRRAMAGLVEKGYATRKRRLQQASVTTLYKVPSIQVTGDRNGKAIRSQVIRQDNTNQGENGQPTLARVFIDTLHPNLSQFDIEYLNDLDDTYSYEAVVAAIKEASTSKGADKRLLGVKYIGKICANSGKGKPGAVPANYREGWHE